ncbi:MAG: hypothetical protein ABIK09_15300 [Pseudomonadota bacterium]
MRLVAAVLLLILALPSGPALGSEADLRKVKRVAVLPLRNFAGQTEGLFLPDQEDPLEARAAGLLADLGARLGAEGLVVIYQDGALRKRVASGEEYEEQVALGRERLSLGREHFLALRQKEAVHSLSRAVEVMERVFHQVVAPEEAAEALELWGVALVESGLLGRAHVAFRRMFHTHPGRRFTAGYHPKPVEKALEDAYRDLTTSVERAIPFVLAETTSTFMKRNKLHALIHPVLVRRGEDVYLELYAFEAPHGYMQWRDAALLDGSDADVERVDRMGSRWLACTPFSTRKVEMDRPRTTQLAAHFAHEVFFQVPTREFQHEMGVSIDWFQRLTPVMDLVVRLDALTVLPDRFRDVQPGYSTIRATIGPLFAWTSRRWSIYGGVGLAVQYIGRFEKTSSPDCKFWAKGSPAYEVRCPASDRTMFPPDLLIGANAVFGTRFYPTPGFFLSLSTSMAMFVYPFDRSIEMNFPLTSLIGAGTRF